jgi:hypothetical protein
MIHNAAGSLSRLNMTDDDLEPQRNASRKSSASSSSSKKGDTAEVPSPAREDDGWEDER